MASITVFPNVEEELIRSLKVLLGRTDNPVAQGVHVSPTKATNPAFKKQIAVRSDGGGTLEGFRSIKEEVFGIRIWAPTYYEANALASVVEALIPLLPMYSKGIRTATREEGPYAIPTETEEELRYITGFCTVEGEKFTLNPPTT